jgi:hypothetical protein
MKSIQLRSIGYAFARGKELKVLAKNEIQFNPSMHRNSRKVRKIVNKLNRMADIFEDAMLDLGSKLSLISDLH